MWKRPIAVWSLPRRYLSVLELMKTFGTMVRHASLRPRELKESSA
jgi:hypothetical protein